MCNKLKLNVKIVKDEDDGRKQNNQVSLDNRVSPFT